jgi:calcineurin-like phosphoesterase family protein
MTNVTSDHHWVMLLLGATRPIASVDEMDRLMIERWNAVVVREDEV